jgi:hypothetical protein
MRRFTASTLLMVVSVSMALAQNPRGLENSQPNGRERTPIQREFHEAEETPTINRVPTSPSRKNSDGSATPDLIGVIRQAAKAIGGWTIPLGLAEMDQDEKW